jgi:hypothetical protein
MNNRFCPYRIKGLLNNLPNISKYAKAPAISGVPQLHFQRLIRPQLPSVQMPCVADLLFLARGRIHLDPEIPADVLAQVGAEQPGLAGVQALPVVAVGAGAGVSVLAGVCGRGLVDDEDLVRAQHLFKVWRGGFDVDSAGYLKNVKIAIKGRTRYRSRDICDIKMTLSSILIALQNEKRTPETYFSPIFHFPYQFLDGFSVRRRIRRLVRQTPVVRAPEVAGHLEVRHGR